MVFMETRGSVLVVRGFVLEERGLGIRGMRLRLVRNEALFLSRDTSADLSLEMRRQFEAAVFLPFYLFTFLPLKMLCVIYSIFLHVTTTGFYSYCLRW